MDSLSNETYSALFHLVGPAGVGLLLFCAFLAYACRALYLRVNELTDKFVEASLANTEALNNLAALIKARR